MYATAEEKNIQDKAQQAATDIRQGARRMRDDVREAANNVKHDLEDIAVQAGKETRHFVDAAERNMSEMAENVSARIQDEPFKYLAISAGVGLVLGLLIGRR